MSRATVSFDLRSPMDDRPRRYREHCGGVSSRISRQIAGAGRRRQRHSAGAGQRQRAQRLGPRSQRHRQRGQDTRAAAADDHAGQAAGAGPVRRLPVVRAGVQLSASPRSASGKDEANASCNEEIASFGGQCACEQTGQADRSRCRQHLQGMLSSLTRIAIRRRWIVQPKAVNPRWPSVEQSTRNDKLPMVGCQSRASRQARTGNDVQHCYLPDRLQPGLDLRAARLQERRQRQFLAERLHRLVGRKARAVGGDLEQDAVGLAEIQAAEIEAVDLAGVGNAASR